LILSTSFFFKEYIFEMSIISQTAINLNKLYSVCAREVMVVVEVVVWCQWGAAAPPARVCMREEEEVVGWW
jgi:hypothetical protein